MKTIENRQITLNVANNPTTQTYSELIYVACNRPSNPQVGFTYEDMKSIDRVDEVCKNKEAAELNFEDSDFIFVKSRVESMGWGLNDKELIKFIEEIKNTK